MTDAGVYLALMTRKAALPIDRSRAVIIPPVEEAVLDQDRALALAKELDQFVARADFADADTLQSSVDRALEKLCSDGAAAHLTQDEAMSLEALVVIDGMRPVVGFQDKRLALDGATLGEWGGVTARDAAIIETVAQSVGRINLHGKQAGTGFVVTEGAVMTNRHVIAEAVGQSGGLAISFSDDGEAGRAFDLDIGGVQMAQGADGRDYALIPVAKGQASKDLPAPLQLEDSRSFVQKSRPVYVLGYPGKPPPGGERFSLLHRLFNCDYGRKRYCPGEISVSIGEINVTSDQAVFGHDCTTLGGSSGSPVIDLGDSSATVVGLHFAGIKRVSNYAYSFAGIRDELEDQGLNYI